VQSGPFVITYGPNPADPTGNTFLVEVTMNGVFQSSPTPNDLITVSNINTKFNLNPNDTIWLEGPMPSDGTAAIKSFGNGDTSFNPAAGAWTTGGIVEQDSGTPPAQKVFRKQIVTFVADANGKPSLKTQTTTTNLVLKNTAIAGIAALYPEPI
jgi:hypothetical protein